MNKGKRGIVYGSLEKWNRLTIKHIDCFWSIKLITNLANHNSQANHKQSSTIKIYMGFIVSRTNGSLNHVVIS